MTTSVVRLDDDTVWTQITDGVESFAVHLMDMGGDNTAKISLRDTEPTSSTQYFILKEEEGFSSITHPGKVWAKLDRGDLVLLAVNK